MAACESDARFGSVVSAPLLEKMEMLRLAILAASGFRPESSEVWNTPDNEPYSMSGMMEKRSSCRRLS
jgi:hypothetical protein